MNAFSFILVKGISFNHKGNLSYIMVYVDCHFVRQIPVDDFSSFNECIKQLIISDGDL